MAPTPATPSPVLEIPPLPARPPLRWRRALRSLRELLDVPEDTDKAIDLVYAIGGNDFERSFHRFAASAGGRRLLAQRPSLADALSDRAALEALPEESFGRAYLAYVDRNGFEPRGLLAVQDRVRARWEAEEGTPPLDPLRRWFQERIILSHDLFHVLTDYGTDDVGEATLLAFSLAQLGGRAQWLLTVGAALEVARRLGPRWFPYLARAWRRGRRAVWLPALPWEEMLPLPLETARRLAGVAPAEEAHPGGIWRRTFERTSAAA
jgi:ubiquinone biosynthesis protein COQ4